VLIVDDHTIVRKGLRMFLELQSGIKVIGEAGDGHQAVELAGRLTPDVILMDLVMPQMDGIKAIAEIKQRWPDIEIIALTSFLEDERVLGALKAGAIGYLLKDAEENVLIEAIQAAHRGEVRLHPKVAKRLMKKAVGESGQEMSVEALTEREREVLGLLARGLSNRAIARALGLTEGTVKIHVSNILSKLNVRSRTQAAIYALRNGMVSIQEDEPEG